MYSNNPHAIDDLKMAITEYIRSVDRAVLNTVFENTVRRVNKCPEIGGETFWTLLVTFCIVIIRCTEIFWSPSICIYIYIYIYVCVCVHIYIYTYVYVLQVLCVTFLSAIHRTTKVITFSYMWCSIVALDGGTAYGDWRKLAETVSIDPW